MSRTVSARRMTGRVSRPLIMADDYLCNRVRALSSNLIGSPLLGYN